MALQVEVRDIRDVAVVDLAGKIVLGAGCGQVRAAVADLLASGRKNILLNLNEVTQFDSSGLGELVGSYVTATNRGGMIKLLNVQKRINDLLLITKLSTIFEVYSNQNLAVLSFNPVDSPGGA